MIGSGVKRSDRAFVTGTQQRARSELPAKSAEGLLSHCCNHSGVERSDKEK